MRIVGPESVAENIGDLGQFQKFLSRVWEMELHIHALMGIDKPTKEAKDRLTLLFCGFALKFADTNPDKEQFEAMLRDVGTIGISFNSFARRNPKLWGQFGYWFYYDGLLDEVTKIIESRLPVEISKIMTSFVLEQQHDLALPLATLGQGL